MHIVAQPETKDTNGPTDPEGAMRFAVAALEDRRKENVENVRSVLMRSVVTMKSRPAAGPKPTSDWDWVESLSEEALGHLDEAICALVEAVHSEAGAQPEDLELALEQLAAARTDLREVRRYAGRNLPQPVEVAS